MDFLGCTFYKLEYQVSQGQFFYSALQEDHNICLIANLRRYIEMTAPYVVSMAAPKPLFITSRKSFHRAHPATLGYWILDTLKMAGLDTERFTQEVPVHIRQR